MSGQSTAQHCTAMAKPRAEMKRDGDGKAVLGHAVNGNGKASRADESE
jgi:hypothetical protein